MSETNTKWVLVETLSEHHSRITPEQMKSGKKIPPVKSEKVWMEGEVVYDTSERVEIDTGDEHFSVPQKQAFDSIPQNAHRKKRPLDE